MLRNVKAVGGHETFLWTSVFPTALDGPFFQRQAPLDLSSTTNSLSGSSLVSEVVVDIPDVSAQGVGRSLQGPGDQGQLAAEEGLVEVLGGLS